jgi:hypothetical protein
MNRDGVRHLSPPLAASDCVMVRQNKKHLISDAIRDDDHRKRNIREIAKPPPTSTNAKKAMIVEVAETPTEHLSQHFQRQQRAAGGGNACFFNAVYDPK